VVRIPLISSILCPRSATARTPAQSEQGFEKVDRLLELHRTYAARTQAAEQRIRKEYEDPEGRRAAEAGVGEGGTGRCSQDPPSSDAAVCFQWTKGEQVKSGGE